MAGTYRVIVPTVVRKAAKMDSDVADPPRLEAGAEIEVTDCVKVRAGKRAKVQRLHFAGGWVSERSQAGTLLLEHLRPAEGAQESGGGSDGGDESNGDDIDDDEGSGSPILGVMKAAVKMQVQSGVSAASRPIGELHIGDAVGVLEEREHKGHTRVRIVTQHAEEAWCSRKIDKGEVVRTQLETDESLTEAPPWVPTHESTVFDEIVQFKVLASCTVRTGPEKDDNKVGEYNKGTLLDMIQEVINFRGITTYQSITPAKGQLMGGWVKLKTSKGKVLLERVEPEADTASDPVREKSEAAVLEFLASRGHAEILSRVCKALASGGGEDDPEQWLGDLEAMDKDGDLVPFLDMCHATLVEPKEDEAPEDEDEDGSGEQDEPDSDDAEPLDFAGGPVKFLVLATCTVRDGPDASTVKVGEHKQGDNIHIVQEARNSDGLKVYQTITAPEGANRGGWVKLKTSKGKELLSLCEQFDSSIDDADDEAEAKAPDPKEPPRDLVALQKFFGKMGKVKVKITIDGAGIYVVEDNKEGAKMCSYSTRRIVRWETERNTFKMVAKERDDSKSEVVFVLKSADELGLALRGAVMAACAWKIDADAWQNDGLTEEEKEEKAAAKVQKQEEDKHDREMRKELTGQRLKELRKRAKEVGVPEDVLEDATDSEEPKEAVILAILAHHAAKIGSFLPQRPSEGEPPQRQSYAIDPIKQAETVAKKKADDEKGTAQAEALLQEAARLIDWTAGMVIDVDTEDGFEKGATILGPSSEGNAAQMQVRFADGSVDDWDKEDFVSREADCPVPDTDATGKSAAIALQQEILKHGTSDVAKIQRLRRASLEPDGAGDAMAAAAEIAAAAAAVDQKIASLAATAAAEQKIALLEQRMQQLSESLAKETQAHGDTRVQLQQVQERLTTASSQVESLTAAAAGSQALLAEVVVANATAKQQMSVARAADQGLIQKMTAQLEAVEAAHAQTSDGSTVAVEAALTAAAAARSEADAAKLALEQHKVLQAAKDSQLAEQQSQQSQQLGSLDNNDTSPEGDELIAAKGREITKLRSKLNSLEEMMLSGDDTQATVTWMMMDEMLTSDTLLTTEDERWT